MKELNELTEEDLADIWLMIGGVPHLFNQEEVKDWIENGTQIEGLLCGALEMSMIVDFLKEKGYKINAE